MMLRNSILLAALLFFGSLPIPAQTGVDYFKGEWSVLLKDGPKDGFRWEVKPALDGSWLGGKVTREGKDITNDFWRLDGKKIDRIAISSKGLIVRVSSTGWDGDTLVFTGVASSSSGEFNVRETITRSGPNKFRAVWERQDSSGKWTEFSDETCTRLIS